MRRRRSRHPSNAAHPHRWTLGSRSIAVAATVAIAFGCGGDSDAAKLVASSAARATPTAEAAGPVASATDRFGGELFTTVAATSSKNVIVSPYSVAVALAMTRAGAAGETRVQLDRVLHLAGLDADAGFNALEQTLATRTKQVKAPDGKKLEVKVATANALWPQRGYPFEPAFLDLLARQYGAGLHVVDYQRDTEGARRTINRWVSDRTAEKITELIPKGALDSLARLVLTNAVYLKAAWAEPFDESATAQEQFTRLDGSAVSAPFMHQTGEYGYASGTGWQALELPYAGGDLAMDIILPDAGRFAAVSAALRDGPAQFVDRLDRRTARVALPKFRFRTQVDLVDALGTLGITELFDPDRADLSGMTSTERLYVSGVLHEAFIDVNEKGTEATAATAVLIRASAAPTQPIAFTIDRPFIVVLRDLETKAELFLAQVLDPTA